VPAVRDDGRLPATVIPLRYALAFDIDPSAARFTGTAHILASVPQATSYVVLHGRDLHITRADAELANGAVPATASTRKAHGATEADELVLHFAKPLPAGELTLRIDYDAPFADSLSGIYHLTDGGRPYAFSQFEATDARRAFPCFDEPSFKVPFDVSVQVPAGMIAASNSPEETRKEQGKKVAFTFATTPPLPTYLVALAVGDLEIREGKQTPVPIRLITTKGKSSLGGPALESTAALVQLLGDYFGIPYPYAKLDIVAVPDFASGAMENAGFVTFREETLLLDARASAKSRYNVDLTIAHELAHQWFGDLVTAEWWNDIWLNEGFAAWMEAKIVDVYRPGTEGRLSAVRSGFTAMDLDGLPSARAVRQPVTSEEETEQAFDQITYDKGSSVIGMIERFVGPDKFREGVRRYLRANAWKSVRAESFLGELDRVSAQDVSRMASTFFDQTGVPAIAVDKKCGKGQWDLTLTQYPWQPLGAAPPPRPLKQWDVPVCMKVGTQVAPICMELKEHATTVKESGACPAFIDPNDAGSGYYRFVLEEPDALALARSVGKLDVASRLGLVSNLWAQTRAGRLDGSTLLSALAAFDGQTDPDVVVEEISTLGKIADALVDERQWSLYRAYVAARLAARKRDLGWKRAAAAKASPAEDRRSILRAKVLIALGNLADDQATLRESATIASAWLKNPNDVDPDAGPVAVVLASRHAGPERFEQLRAVLKNAKSPEQRTAALKAMGAFGDPALLTRAFDLTLTDEVRAQDIRYVVVSALQYRASRRTVFEWLKRRWDEATKKASGALGKDFLRVLDTMCTRAELDEARAFFTPRVAQIYGSSRELAEKLEAASQCVELRKTVGPSVAKALAK
jgi:alanyl aminopeptidase